MQNTPIQEVKVHKHLGIFIANDCSWHEHIAYIKDKAWNRINIMRRLKHTLDRKALDIIYCSFIRPNIENSDVVFDNCCHYEKDDLEKIQIEAARIVSGCTKLVSITELYREVGWETLDTRRRKHKLVLMYKITTNLTPAYLKSIVPDTVGANNPYPLRNGDDIRNVTTRTTTYSNSFVPSTITEWNKLPLDTRNAVSLTSFKHLLNIDVKKPNILYNYGKRRQQMLHSRLRTKCSSLNQHLFKCNIVLSPLCTCGAIESVSHYFLECQQFTHQREVLVNAIAPYTSPTIPHILFGDESLDLDINTIIFDAVHLYIKCSKRFDT